MPYDVFISAKSQDYPHARVAADFLRSAGLRVFFSEQELPEMGNSDYFRAIDEALEDSRHMLLVTSSRAHASAGWVEKEWRTFLNEKLSRRKTGNLVTLLCGDMTVGDLPISLRQHEARPSGDLPSLLKYFKDRSSSAPTSFLTQPSPATGEDTAAKREPAPPVHVIRLAQAPAPAPAERKTIQVKRPGAQQQTLEPMKPEGPGPESAPAAGERRPAAEAPRGGVLRRLRERMGLTTEQAEAPSRGDERQEQESLAREAARLLADAEAQRQARLRRQEIAETAVKTAFPSTPAPLVRREAPRVGRNDPCPCGSGKKYKKCCGAVC